MNHLRLAAVILACNAPLAAAQPVSTESLLREMTDLARLADFPDPPYKTVQYSSYDRRSSLPGGPGWFANADGFGGEPIPGFEAVVSEPDDAGVGEYLICDVRGPGAIVRTWTAAIGGRIRLDLDDADTPLYDGDAAAFLSGPYNAIAGAHGVASLPDGLFRQQQAAYCPIPFAKRCRMVWIGRLKEVHFYQVQIRHYASGAEVRTFSPEDLASRRALLDETARVLAAPAREFQFASRAEPRELSAALKPGESKEVLRLAGPAAVQRLTLRVEATDRDRALRQTLLHIHCDDFPWGQVQAPVGDFFGAAPGVNPFDALPFTVDPDGTMTCRYVMPFEKSLRIVLENRGEQDVHVSGSALPMEYAWTNRSMHFRARWRVDHELLGSPRAVQDIPFLVTSGRGRYVGTAIMLLNPCAAPTPYGGWWGEGDEKVFVDDDARPSTFGTGSEDYFNYAWSVPDIFGFAYCGQPRDDGPGNRGFVTNQRWHIVDDLPFLDRIGFFMELYPHDETAGISYARIGYHYARPGAWDDHVAISDEDLRPLALPANWQPAAAFAMRNSKYYQVEDLVEPAAKTSLVEGNLWAGGRMLVWRPAADDILSLRFTVAEAGRKRLHLACALNAESGRVQAELDGKPVAFDARADGIDLHVPHRLLARQFGTEVLELAAGQHTLSLRFSGADAAIANPAIGVDYLAVQSQTE